MSEEEQQYGEPQAEEQGDVQQEPAQEEYQGPKDYKGPCPTIEKCIQLNQLLPVSNLDKNIDAISTAIYDYDDLLNEFLQKVDNRTTVNDEDPRQPYIKCEQNREGDSYRSPWTNKYDPPTDGSYPSPKLRALEERLNQFFKIYIKSYYSTVAHCSCYCWDLGSRIEDGFGVAIVIKNAVNQEKKLKGGAWDSSNLMTVKFKEEGGKIIGHYSLTTTISVGVEFSNQVSGDIKLSGTLARNKEATQVLKEYCDPVKQVEIIGSMTEEMETELRSKINNIYVQKSQEIIDTARYNPTMGKPGMKQAQLLKNAFMAGKK